MSIKSDDISTERNSADSLPDNDETLEISSSDAKTYTLARKIFEGLGLILLNLITLGFINFSATICDEYKKVFTFSPKQIHVVDPIVKEMKPLKKKEIADDLSKTRAEETSQHPQKRKKHVTWAEHVEVFEYKVQEEYVEENEELTVEESEDMTGNLIKVIGGVLGFFTPYD